VKALEGMGWLTQGQGDTALAEATYEEMLELSQELNDKGNVATALNSLGTLAVARGDNERAKALLEENLEVLRQLEEEGNADPTLKRFHALNLLGILAINQEGDYLRGATLWEESLALAREVGDTHRVVMMLTNLGYAALLQGEYERVTTLSEEARALARDLVGGGREIVAEPSINSGLASLQQGHHKQADTSFKEALAISQEAGMKASIINALEGMASLAGALGEATRAAHLWGIAEAAREATGIALPPGERALHEPYLASAQSQLGDAAWEEALAEGRTMSLEEGPEYAFSKEVEPAAPTFPAPEGLSADQPSVALTSREKEVALLVAKELSNRQIASELMLSEHTVATHIRNILKKLGLRSRTQVAAWFTEHSSPS
jgi:DNA-binding CsgD family transcriptional regulator/tetratricopeptide (TPR) repeat protein